MSTKPTYQELEKELESHRITASLLEKSLIIRFIWKNEKNWPVEFVSENVATILEYTTEDFLSRKITYSEIIHPDDYYRVLSEVDENENKDIDVNSFEHSAYRIITKSGLVKWVKDITYIIRDKNQKITHYEGLIIDITQQEKNDKLIIDKEKEEKSKKKYKSLFENMSEAFALHRIIQDDNDKVIDYVFLEVNQAFEVQTGLKMENIKNKKVTEVIPGIENDSTNWIKEYGTVALSGKPIKFEQYSEGLNKWYSVVSFSPKRGYFATLFSDITQKKHIEKELNKQNEELIIAKEKAENNQEKYRSLFNSIRDAIIVVDTNRIIVHCNPAFLSLFGYLYDEIIGKNTIILLQNENSFIEIGRKIKKNNINKSALYNTSSFKKKNNELFLGEASIHFLNDREENTIGFIGLIRDITKRKKIEQELISAKEKAEESEERFKKLSDLTIEGILIHRNGIAIDANKALLNISGYKYNELIGANIQELIIPKRYHSFMLDKKEQKYVSVHEVEIIRKDGNLIPVEVEAFDFFQHGEKIRVTAFRDISEKKEIEKRIMNVIINTEEKEKRKFATELHDGLGPILSTINLYVQALKITKEPDRILIAINRIQDSINEAIKSAQEISNNISPHILENFGLVVALKSFCKKNDKLNGISILQIYNMNERIKNEIETTLYRIITELINNSIKHSNAKDIRIEIKLQKKELTVDYSDNGIGFNIEEARKSVLGMGIHNIYARIKSLHGSITFSSNYNKGMLCKIFIKL